jgi:hypothetical protein
MEAAKLQAPTTLQLRDRLTHRLKELSRLLDNPGNVSKVKAELDRLANG